MTSALGHDETGDNITANPDRLLWSVLAVSLALIVLTVVASNFVAPLPGAPPGSRSMPRMRPAPLSTGEFLRMLGMGSALWYSTSASAPLMLFVSRRFPIERGKRLFSSTVHVATIAALVVVTAYAQHLINYRGLDSAPSFGNYLKVSALASSLPFITVTAIVHALVAQRRAHERNIEAERVRSQLAESRLAALTAQLQPHFLFNTLQGISTLITHDPVAADAMLTSLSDLLREVLRHGEHNEIELQEELRVLEPYLEISRRRFGSRLRVLVDVEPGISRARVPFFVLQPLVENAMHHGISSHASAGRIQIDARRARDARGDNLVLSVADDGPGIVTSDAGRGIGLRNTRLRLQALYPSNHSLESVRPPAGGYKVTVTIPYREGARLPGTN